MADAVNQTINQLTYAAPDIVRYYAQLKALQPAEQLLFEILGQDLSQMKMLDIGVGGGRTTQHFYHRVATYVGTDISAAMISTCQQRFPGMHPEQFQVCDARDMSCFPDQSFDLLLFSYNGIDSVSSTERHQILQEVRRIGKSGGYFYFSSHNLQGLERVFSLRQQLSLNPVTTYTNVVMWTILRAINWPMNLAQLQTLDEVIVRDEFHNFRLATYYIRPLAQQQQLVPYFTDIRVFSWQSTTELLCESDYHANQEMWLYYLCQIP
jgi:ubiquinone/menaquinone biosynthesis C-methylase UbiE